ncbi:MAG: septal ring lytic transglycosylase RlpA family protein [Rhizobacter sp.]
MPCFASPPMWTTRCVTVALTLLMAACTSTPTRSPGDTRPSAAAPVPRTGPALSSDRDGPGSDAPPNLAAVPDAEPQVEAVRPGGPNKPYEVAGRSYVPLTGDVTHVERGIASWYGRKFHGRRTAMGEVYNMYAMTAAHPTLPLPSYVRVRNPKNNKEVVLRVNDRGPFHPGRIIDLSYTAALKLDLQRGVGPVEVERITFEAIRTGSWRSTESRVATTAPTPQALPATVPSAHAPTPERGTALEPMVTATEPRPVAQDITAEAQASPGPPPTTAAGSGFFVQIAAFKQLDGAHAFHRKVVADLSWLSPLLAVLSDTNVHRLQAGPYRSRDEAQGIAEQVRDALKLVPVVVRR